MFGLDITRYHRKGKNWFRIRIGETRFLFEAFQNKIFIDVANYRGKVYS